MFLKKCKCGKSQKNFKMDIGEFFVNDCCLEAGYDHLGNKEGNSEPTSTSEDTVEVSATDQSLSLDSMITEVSPKPVDYSKLTAKELKAIMTSKGLKVFKNMSKKRMVEALEKNASSK